MNTWKTIFLLIFCFNSITFSQFDTTNRFTKYFKNQMIIDFAFVGDTVWILGDDCLIKYSKRDTVKYYIAKDDEGPLSDFAKEKPILDPFSWIGSNGDVVWLYDINKDYFLNIENNYCHSYHFTALKHVFFDYFYVDEQGNLWMVGNYLSINDTWEHAIYVLDRSNGGVFSKMNTALDFTGMNVNLLFIKGNNKYIVGTYNVGAIDTMTYYNYLFIIDNTGNIKRYDLISSRNYGVANSQVFNYLIENGTIYVLDGNGNLYTIYGNSIIRNQRTTLSSRGGCFWIALKDDYLFYTFYNGFQSYNLLNNKTYIIDKYKGDLMGYSFRNIKIKKDELWGNFGGWNGGDCSIISNGIGYYLLKDLK